MGSRKLQEYLKTAEIRSISRRDILVGIILFHPSGSSINMIYYSIIYTCASNQSIFLQFTLFSNHNNWACKLIYLHMQRSTYAVESNEKFTTEQFPIVRNERQRIEIRNRRPKGINCHTLIVCWWALNHWNALCSLERSVHAPGSVYEVYGEES